MERNGFGDSLRAAEDRGGWKGIVATSSVVPQRPPEMRRDGRFQRYVTSFWNTRVSSFFMHKLFQLVITL